MSSITKTGGEAPFQNINNQHSDPFPRKLPEGITFSFSAGGWLQMYMFGVAHALQQSGVIDHHNENILLHEQQKHKSSSKSKEDKEDKEDEEETEQKEKDEADKSSQKESNKKVEESVDENRPVRFVGASAGALAACCLAGDLEMTDVRDFTLECGEHMNSKWYHYFLMKDYVDIAIDKFSTEIMSRDEESGSQEVQDRLRRTLGIYCTVLPFFKKKKFNEFTCVDDIKEALFASLCAAPMVGFPFRLRSTGELVVDGGIAAFQPKSGKSNVITISPFYFANADIRPSQFIPVHWAFKPKNRARHSALFDLGYNDTIDFLVRKGYVAAHHVAANTLRRPDPKAPRRGAFAIFRDLIFLLFSYILLRPIAIVVVYMEMIVVATYYFIKTFIYSSSDAGATFVDWFDTVVNLFSPSVFLHMAVSPRIPVNERRLAKRSLSFRVFAPFFSGTTNPSSDEKYVDNASVNVATKKRFAVHTPIGAPTQTQLLFDRFKNLGWSGPNVTSMFKEENGRVVNASTTATTTTASFARVSSDTQDEEEVESETRANLKSPTQTSSKKTFFKKK